MTQCSQGKLAYAPSLHCEDLMGMGGHHVIHVSMAMAALDMLQVMT